MTSIRYRHNYRLITLTPSGIVGRPAVTGDCIPAMLRDGELHYAPYLGSMDAGLSINRRRVKLVGIVAWSLDVDGVGTWHDIPANGYIMGVYQNGGYYVVLENGEPFHFPI